MRRLKLCFFAALFAALTALKLLCPLLTETLQQQVWSAAQCDVDYTETLTAMGRSFVVGGAGEELISALGFDRQEDIPASTEGLGIQSEDAEPVSAVLP